MSDIAIKVENLSKAYQLGQIGTGTVSRDIERWWVTKVRGKEDPFLKIGQTNDRTIKGDSDIVWSLKDITFEIKQGDAVGIIGRNGAGKSTLLKLLSRVTAPTTGKIKVKGRIASLLEVGTGFHAELSGRENIYLNGAILGMRKKEIDRKFDEIVDFSGVERYIDTPVKRYSSGMYVRLAFAVAAHLDSEILVIDEVLAVGDAEFQKKCLGKMGEVSLEEGRTVLFVSHNLSAVSNLCQNAVLLKNGIVEDLGQVKQVIDGYIRRSTNNNGKYLNTTSSSDRLMIRSIFLTDADSGEERMQFFHNQNIQVVFEIAGNFSQNSEYTLFCTVSDIHGNRIFSSESDVFKTSIISLEIPRNTLVRGDYEIECFIHIPMVTVVDRVENACRFIVLDAGSSFSVHGNYDYGKVFVNVNWSYHNKSE